MGYKVLGFAVWRGVKWYMRRRVGVRGKAAVAGVGAAIVAGALVAGRRSTSSD